MLAADNANILPVMGHSISNSVNCIRSYNIWVLFSGIRISHNVTNNICGSTWVPGVFPHLSYSGSVLQMCWNNPDDIMLSRRHHQGYLLRLAKACEPRSERPFDKWRSAPLKWQCVFNMTVINETVANSISSAASRVCKNWAVTMKNSPDPVDTIAHPVLCCTSKNRNFTFVWKNIHGPFGRLWFLPCESQVRVRQVELEHINQWPTSSIILTLFYWFY